MLCGELVRGDVAYTSVTADEEDLSDAHRVKLHRAIEQSLAEIDTGQTVPFADVIASLRAKRVARRIVDVVGHDMKVSDFDRWVSENNISETFEYSKGWWDYVELVRRFADRLESDDVRVIGHYIVDTPPPCERLPMPAVAIGTPRASFALRFDFGSWSLKHAEICQWVVSVDLRTAYRGPLFGLFDEDHDLRVQEIDGLSPSYLFGSYRQDQTRFSCLLRDEWDVSTLMRILAREP